MVTAELNALNFLRNNPGESGMAVLIAELEKVTAERDALRNMYAHHNTSDTNPYSRRRSQVNKDIQEMEKEIAEELGTPLDMGRARAAAGSGACRAEGGCKAVRQQPPPQGRRKDMVHPDPMQLLPGNGVPSVPVYVRCTGQRLF